MEKDRYGGFKLFAIFESYQRAQEILRNFLETHNRRLLALYLIRNQ